MSSIAEELPKEQARCREVLAQYQSIPQGKFGAILIEKSLREADEAVVSGDVGRILAVYKDLKGIE